MNNEKISFTESEVEALTGLKKKTLQRWRLMNQGPPFVRAGRCVRYPTSSLNAWLNNLPSGGTPRLEAR
jgi:predicted DNA-binding transcriptional regulator AlpA